MAFRTIIVDSHCKLEYSLNYLVHRTGDGTKRVLLDEVHTIVVSSTAVSLTTSLLCELIKRKIKIVFCDEKSNPISELSPLYGAHNASGRAFEQISWTSDIKGQVWKEIVRLKIMNQSKSLARKGKFEESKLLSEYANDVTDGDETNREGHAAKVYFNAVYYKGFTRNENTRLNAILNFGYAILLSAFNRAVVSAGYLTQIGIHHKNEFNQFNLSCDLMEPFRFVVDDIAESLDSDEQWKNSLISLLSAEYIIDGKKQTLANAVNIYVLSVFDALRSGDTSGIKFLANDL